MEQATIASRRASTGSAAGLPPGSRMPAALQALRYARDPLGFLIGLQRRYGDIFTVRFPYFGRLVYVDHARSWSNRSSPARPPRCTPARRTRRCSSRRSARTRCSPSTTRPHMRQRKLLLPPFHGERIEALRRADARGHPAGDGELAGRRALRAAPPHPADHPGGDHARRLRRPRRGRASTRFEGLIESFSRRVNAVIAFPFAAPQPRPLSPWGEFLRARAALDEFIYEEIALRRAEVEAGARSTTTCSRCCSAPATTTAAR